MFLGFRPFNWKIFIEFIKPKNKGHANFYECCDLTKKVCLIVHTAMIIFGFEKKNSSFRGHLQGLVSVICIMCDLPKITLFLDFRALWSVRMSSSLALLAWKTYYIYYATNNPPPPPIPLPPAQLIKIVKIVLLLGIYRKMWKFRQNEFTYSSLIFSLWILFFIKGAFSILLWIQS